MLKGLLLDSGDTLMRPKGGRWNPRFDFEEVVEHHLPGLDPGRFAAAFEAGDRYLERWSEVAAQSTRAGYHREMLVVLGISDPTDDLLEELDRPLPFRDLVEPFDDVAAGLSQLREDGWPIAIVADTAVRMVEVYRELGLDALIDAFVISEEIGCSKPDPRMYHAGSSALGLEPHECIFVDNDDANVRAAIALGYHGCGISRYREPPISDLSWVRDLTELRGLLHQLRRR